ncbi:MAG: hypothetical protein J6L86_03730 [Alphaproteobacteria bacterium]|nr:hypothetical protein [Alphaproteobacteria bacterium]
MKKCVYYFISLLILLPIKSHAKIASNEFIYNPPTLRISTTEEFVDYRFYYTLNPLCRHCWRLIITPNLIIQDNFLGTVELQNCKLLTNQKNFIKYKCTNIYTPGITDIIEFKIGDWDPTFKAYIVTRNNFEIDGRHVSRQTYLIDSPKQEKD